MILLSRIPQMTALADVRKKWHIPPAFSVEFIGYYLDRIARMKDLKTSLNHQMQLNKQLTDDQQRLRNQYDELMQSQTQHSQRNLALTETARKLHAAISALCPNKTLPNVDQIGVPPPPPPTVAVSVIVPADPPAPVVPKSAPHLPAPPPIARPMSVPTAAALKMGVGFPLTNLPGTHEDPNRILSTQCLNHSSKLMHECGICAKCTDQHLLAKCDTCHLHYHLGCLNPPLSRHPKKSKLYGWQCSECVKSDDSDAAVSLPIGPRKSRTKYGKDGTIVPVDPQYTDDSMAASTESLLNISEPPKSTPAKADKIKTIKQKTCDKRPHDTDPLAMSPSEDNVDPLDTNSSATHSAAKRKKVKKSATVVDDRAAPAAQPEDRRSSTAAPSQECPPVADKDQDPMDNSKSNGTVAEPATVAVKSPAKTKPSKKQKKEKILANLTNNNAQNMSADNPPIPATAAPPPPKPTYYIDQNGVLNCLPGAGHFTAELIPTKPPTTPASVALEAINNSVAMTEKELLLLHKQNRKRRKEKHRNKHHHHHHHASGENGDANGERSSPKKKRKKKSSSHHDMENPASNIALMADGIPRIKIKVSWILGARGFYGYCCDTI